MVVSVILFFTAPIATVSHAFSPEDENRLVDEFKGVFAPEENRAAARTADVPQQMPPRGRATMVLLETVRNWDNFSEDTRSELSRYIEVTPPERGTRRVVSKINKSCTEALSETSDLTMDSQHFKAVYTTSGEHAATADFVSTSLTSAEYVWDYEVNTIGLPAPKTPADGKIRLYFCDLLGSNYPVYGLTWTETIYADDSALTRIELDNDYSGFVLPQGMTEEDFSALVFAHEFFHAIQFGINYMAPTMWLLETNAVWMEEEVYPDADDYLTSYVTQLFQSLSTSIDTNNNSFEYGASQFFRHITENVTDRSFIVDLWSTLGDECSGAGPAWCQKSVSEIPLVETLLSGRGAALPTVYRDFNTANYTKDYIDGSKAIFPDVLTTTVTLGDSTVEKSSSLSHLAARFYEISCPDCDPLVDVDITFSGTENPSAWNITLVREAEGQYEVSYMTLEAGAGSAGLTMFDTSAQKAVVIVNNTSQAFDYQSYTLTFDATPSGTQVPYSFPEGWNMVGFPYDTPASTPSGALGLPGTKFFQFAEDSYIYEKTEIGQPAAGSAYWAYFQADISGNATVVESDTTSVALTSGWNMVSVPYATGAVWGPEISVSSGGNSYALDSPEAAGLIETGIYTFDGSTFPGEYLGPFDYDDGYTISPWRGFLVRALQDCALVFPGMQ